MNQISEISLDSSITQGEGNIVSDMNGEKVMLNIQNGKYYNLGVIGGEIWSLIHIPMTINEIVENMIARYDVEKNVCKAEVMDFVNQLLNENLIRKVNKC